MSKLFGTDGIRGVVGVELSKSLAYRVGLALGYIINKDKSNNKVLIGRDTRASGDMLISSIRNALINMGVDIIEVGVMPTPAISYLVNKYETDAGIMITASHNPFKYNGIKIFNGDGYKLSDELEEKIEDIINNGIDIKLSDNKGMILDGYDPVGDYVEYLVSCVDNDLSGLSVVVDCANGSASRIVRNLFKNFSCDVEIINDEPDGYNINKNCGSLYVDKLCDYVVYNKFDVGISYDGDADRCILVDNLGNIIDGDYILAILANHFGYKDLVGTVMSNLGLEEFCRNNNINFIRTKVGDRFVLEEMVNNNYMLGGEQSGHIIIRDYSRTGDGELTSIKILEIMNKENKSLSELASIMNKYPQIIVNVSVDNNKKYEWEFNKLIKNKIEELKDELGSDYRVLVRASGTESLIRIMVEGSDVLNIEEKVNKLADFIGKSLN